MIKSIPFSSLCVQWTKWSTSDQRERERVMKRKRRKLNEYCNYISYRTQWHNNADYLTAEVLFCFHRKMETLKQKGNATNALLWNPLFERKTSVIKLNRTHLNHIHFLINVISFIEIRFDNSFNKKKKYYICFLNFFSFHLFLSFSIVSLNVQLCVYIQLCSIKIRWHFE